MSMADRLKEEIGWLKVAFGIGVAFDASLLAWFAQNYEKADPPVVTLGLLAILVISVAVAWVNVRAYGRLKELEKV